MRGTCGPDNHGKPLSRQIWWCASIVGTDFIASLRTPPYLTAQRFAVVVRSEEHTSELQSRQYLVCRLLLETKKRMREQLVKFRTAQINGLRGLLTEYGAVMRQGRAGIKRDMSGALGRLSARLPLIV